MAPPDVGKSGITPEQPQNPRRLHAVEPAPRSPERPRQNLPSELSSFVGREKELAEVRRLLEDARLLTLTGSGGCGKTRLALTAAGEVVERFEDGVWMVELAPMADPSLVPQAVASTLDVREQPGRSPTETLSGYLSSKNMLLVLDNCEHLIEACLKVRVPGAFNKGLFTRVRGREILGSLHSPGPTPISAPAHYRCFLPIIPLGGRCPSVVVLPIGPGLTARFGPLFRASRRERVI
jgi:hypothetical protein